MATVFDAFPKAIVTGVWSIGQYQRGTLVGNQYKTLANLDVIISEGQQATFGSAPNAETISTDMLIYVRPEQLPTTNLRVLASSYVLTDGVDYFEIIDASAGKNQENGVLEHIELGVRQTEAIENVESV